MDAVKYFKEKARMMKKCADVATCQICPLAQGNNGTDMSCTEYELECPEKAAAIVGKWAMKHPAKTRQSEFLKAYPHARIEDGVLCIHPCDMDTGYIAQDDDQCRAYVPQNPVFGCGKCRREYWLAEVE